MKNLIVNPETQLITVEDSSPTVSVLWDRVIQQAIVNTNSGSTVASRAYGMVHTAIFDAWAAYDQQAIATQLGDALQRPEAEVTEANKQEAISYAAYEVAKDLFPDQIAIFYAQMKELGYNPQSATTDLTTPAGVGQASAQALLDFRHHDGSNQLGDDPASNGVPYSDVTNYQPTNSPQAILDLESWTPENVTLDDPNSPLQQFLTPQWGKVTPFALDSGGQFRPETPEPFLLVNGNVDLEAKTITLEDGSVLAIDRSLIGTVINPEFINQATEVVNYSANLTDEQKLVAEFWADENGTAFLPRTWMTFGDFVSARDEHSLDDDVKLFFALSNATFDASIATWDAKTFYDSPRPVQVIRELGELGLIGEFNPDLGGYAIEAWQPGAGKQTILATDFLPYQLPGENPALSFAEYTSEHSAFSAAGAKVLDLFTGSDEFGAEVSFEVGKSLVEPEITPQAVITLSWDTFTEAVEAGGMSPRYGGIHFAEGDLNGRSLGSSVGKEVFERSQFYINGGVETESFSDFTGLDLFTQPAIEIDF